MNRLATRKVRRLRLGLLLWGAGMLGVVAFVALGLPSILSSQLPPGEELPMPLWAIALLSAVQTGGLLALAVWAGTALARKVELHAPTFEAVAAGHPPLPALRPQLVPGLAGATAGGILFLVARLLQPPALVAPEWHLLLRVLYGGITEELLLRWGFMTLLLWLAWRFVQRRSGPPRAAYAWAAIAISALVFAVAHLPVTALLVGELTGAVVMYVVGFNAAFGVVFGYLFWRYGLEAAIIAHAGAHVLNYIVNLS